MQRLQETLKEEAVTGEGKLATQGGSKGQEEKKGDPLIRLGGRRKVTSFTGDWNGGETDVTKDKLPTDKGERM